MRLLDVSFQSPLDNLMGDDVLLMMADKFGAGEALRFWESSCYFGVLGRTCDEQYDFKRETVLQDCLEVYRRSSGGGTVIQGAGCLNFALVLSKELRPEIEQITASYQYIGDRIKHVFRRLNVEIVFRPISDLALAETNQKFSGNAQRRGRNYILHHGTLLYDFDLSLIERYLNMPKDVPEYRKQRNHLDFVTNIPCSVDDIKKAFIDVFQPADIQSGYDDQEMDLIQDVMLRQKLMIDF